MYDVSRKALKGIDAILDYTVVNHGGAQALIYYTDLNTKFETLACAMLKNSWRNEASLSPTKSCGAGV
jgi:plasmid stabilization system protein ParE